MIHDTATTIHRLKKLTKGLFVEPLVIHIHSANEHDSLVNGNPVASVELERAFEIYPDTAPGKRPGSLDQTMWVVERIVEDNDPDVGMFGSEPEVWGTFHTLDTALMELALAVARQHMEQVLEGEAGVDMAEELEHEAMQAKGWKELDSMEEGW